MLSVKKKMSTRFSKLWDSCDVHKLTHAEKFLPGDTKVHTTIRAMVITYIQPTNEVLEPPIEKDHSNVSKKYVVYNNKLFQLVDIKPMVYVCFAV